ncbi:hypothetical protein TIFTF001_017797 [Ficus carica]|uniref:Uncharacterized protein n=1 Tax=Ficus carica TaxID=3494 RepID=A0AA88ABA9_FICCA|nr:hypothetical protein TIFTF001_017797 [Ficus carica]
MKFVLQKRMKKKKKKKKKGEERGGLREICGEEIDKRIRRRQALPSHLSPSHSESGPDTLLT